MINVKLINGFWNDGAVVVRDKGEKDERVLLCFASADFEDYNYKRCEEFNGETVTSAPSSRDDHSYGCLGLLEKNPFAVGGKVVEEIGKPWILGNRTEALIDDEWQQQEDFP